MAMGCLRNNIKLYMRPLMSGKESGIIVYLLIYRLIYCAKGGGWAGIDNK
jgi:hypothetical protein